MPDDLDEDLLRRFIAGERDAFEALFRQFQGEVYRWILRIVRDTDAAEDLTIDAFWRASKGRARFDPARSFGAWMRTIATNVTRDHLGRVKRRGVCIPIGHDVAAPQQRDVDAARAMTAAFRALSPRLHVVAMLALVEERPYDEIADALDLPLGTVKSRVFRATRALRKELARLGVRP
jgi:RNA polymerase sigma factor (sigma-70 family)